VHLQVIFIELLAIAKVLLCKFAIE